MLHKYVKSPFYVLFLLSITILKANSQNSLTNNKIINNLYAGIEVGSKGVKMSLLEISKEGMIKGDYKVLKDTSVNTDFISFTNQTFKATLSGLCGLYKQASVYYQIPSENIFTVFSSGVKAVADREEKTLWLNNMIDSFRNEINEPNRTMNIVDVQEEARLSHIGIIPQSKRFNTFLIDIGSGNTKGGYFPSGNINDFRLFQITWGTKSISNAAEKRLDEDKTIAAFQKQILRVLAGQADEEITYAVNVSGAYNMSDNVAVSGGIAWATATLMYPELADNPVVPIQYDELVKFFERVYSKYSTLTDSAIVKNITDKSLDKTLISSEIKKVNKVFDQKALISGTGLLLKILRQFEGVYDRKQFYLVKNGQVGWISAYVSKSLGNK